MSHSMSRDDSHANSVNGLRVVDPVQDAIDWLWRKAIGDSVPSSPYTGYRGALRQRPTVRIRTCDPPAQESG